MSGAALVFHTRYEVIATPGYVSVKHAFLERSVRVTIHILRAGLRLRARCRRALLTERARAHARPYSSLLQSESLHWATDTRFMLAGRCSYDDACAISSADCGYMLVYDSKALQQSYKLLNTTAKLYGCLEELLVLTTTAPLCCRIQDYKLQAGWFP